MFFSSRVAPEKDAATVLRAVGLLDGGGPPRSTAAPERRPPRVRRAGRDARRRGARRCRRCRRAVCAAGRLLSRVRRVRAVEPGRRARFLAAGGAGLRRAGRRHGRRRAQRHDSRRRHRMAGAGRRRGSARRRHRQPSSTIRPKRRAARPMDARWFETVPSARWCSTRWPTAWHGRDTKPDARPLSNATPGQRDDRVRVAVVADLLEERWPSMDLMAEMLMAELGRDDRAASSRRCSAPDSRRASRRCSSAAMVAPADGRPHRASLLGLPAMASARGRGRRLPHRRSQLRPPGQRPAGGPRRRDVPRHRCVPDAVPAGPARVEPAAHVRQPRAAGTAARPRWSSASAKRREPSWNDTAWCRPIG